MDDTSRDVVLFPASCPTNTFTKNRSHQSGMRKWKLQTAKKTPLHNLVWSTDTLTTAHSTSTDSITMWETAAADWVMPSLYRIVFSTQALGTKSSQTREERVINTEEYNLFNKYLLWHRSWQTGLSRRSRVRGIMPKHTYSPDPEKLNWKE